MSSWFWRDDVELFEPADRYITGEELIERWAKHPGLRPEAFIRAKIAESRLVDLHPTFGGTQGTYDDQANFPPLAAGLFPMSNIERIEAEDELDFSPVSPNSDAPVQESAYKRYTKSEVKREARKLDTQTMYASWQKKYRELKRSKPGNSDSWCAKQIAKLGIAKDRDAETIRKNMKK